MAKTASQDNVVIIDPETDEIETQTDMSDTPTEFVQTLKEGYTVHPTPTESAGKGKKYCPNCHDKISARITECDNCGWAFVKGASKAPKASATGVRKARATNAPQAAVVDPYAVYKVLKGRGYGLTVTADILDPQATPQINCDKEIQPLIDIINSDSVQLLSTSPSITFKLGLDEMMKLLKIKERK